MFQQVLEATCRQGFHVASLPRHLQVLYRQFSRSLTWEIDRPGTSSSNLLFAGPGVIYLVLSRARGNGSITGPASPCTPSLLSSREPFASALCQTIQSSRHWRFRAYRFTPIPQPCYLMCCNGRNLAAPTIRNSWQYLAMVYVMDDARLPASKMGFVYLHILDLCSSLLQLLALLLTCSRALLVPVGILLLLNDLEELPSRLTSRSPTTMRP